VIEPGVEVVVPMSRAETEKFIKAAAIGMMRIMGAVVPLSKASRGVSRSLENIRDGDFVGAHILPSPRDAVGPGAKVITPGEKTRSCRSTNGTDVETIEPRSLLGELVQVGCIDEIVTVRVDVPPALVVGHDEQDVGLFMSESLTTRK